MRLKTTDCADCATTMTMAITKKLLGTGHAALIEGNDWGDRFWGVEINIAQQRGANWLGVLLMIVREEVASEKKISSPGYI